MAMGNLLAKGYMRPTKLTPQCFRSHLNKEVNTMGHKCTLATHHILFFLSLVRWLHQITSS